MTWVVLAAALAGCSIERTTRVENHVGSWSPGDIDLFPGVSLSIENPTTHERIAVDVAEDGRVHAERAKGDRVDVVDADSYAALKRDHPEVVAALRECRIEWRIHWEVTEVRRD
jgi:hypothetical protein